jgi:hypothetical protein
MPRLTNQAHSVEAVDACELDQLEKARAVRVVPKELEERVGEVGGGPLVSVPMRKSPNAILWVRG